MTPTSGTPINQRIPPFIALPMALFLCWRGCIDIVCRCGYNWRRDKRFHSSRREFAGVCNSAQKELRFISFNALPELCRGRNDGRGQPPELCQWNFALKMMMKLGSGHRARR